MKKLKHECDFCGASTNFTDNGHHYCIDCYCKLRNSAHTHDTPSSLPKPLPITPQPTFPFPQPYNPWPNGGIGVPQIIC